MIFAGLMGVAVVIALIGVTWLALATEPRHRRVIRSPVAQRVVEGVARLDAAVPDWWNHVDVTRLRISSCHQCILGQVYGDFLLGSEALGFRTLTEIRECGFLHVDEHDEIRLFQEWVNLIGTRLGWRLGRGNGNVRVVADRQNKEQYV